LTGRGLAGRRALLHNPADRGGTATRNDNPKPQPEKDMSAFKQDAQDRNHET
jgi:hypothetical protein